MTDSNDLVDRDASGKFQPGNSVARRSASRQSMLMRDAIEPHREALLDRMLAIATGSGVAAARAAEWLLTRLGGPSEVQTVLPRIEGLSAARTPAEKARASCRR